MSFKRSLKMKFYNLNLSQISTTSGKKIDEI